MRYFVEVTEDEAKRFERAGTARVAIGSSGGSASIESLFDGPWCLLRTPAATRREAEEE